jgi:hypothetical protein
MTINLGELDDNMKKYIGTTQSLKVVSIAKDEKVLAVGVTGFYSKNNNPHITIAIDRKAGAKPKMSNDLTNWKELNQQLTITGIVTEIKAK